MKPRTSVSTLVLAFAMTVHPAGVDAQNATEAGTSIIPFPFFFYTPETNLAFGATLIVYKTLPCASEASAQTPRWHRSPPGAGGLRLRR